MERFIGLLEELLAFLHILLWNFDARMHEAGFYTETPYGWG